MIFVSDSGTIDNHIGDLQQVSSNLLKYPNLCNLRLTRFLKLLHVFQKSSFATYSKNNAQIFLVYLLIFFSQSSFSRISASLIRKHGKIHIIQED